MSLLYGVSGSGRNVSSFYVGVDGVARKVKSAYIGIDGKAMLFYGGEYVPEINQMVVSIVKGQHSTEDIVYPAGRYRVDIAGMPAQDSAYLSNNCFSYEVDVKSPFKIVAYCGDTASISALGLVYAHGQNGGIFGGGAGKDANVAIATEENYGNSLSAYGAVCHFVPVGGTFGTNYLCCFHAAPSPKGGAYGGGCGGRGARGIRPGGGTLTITNFSGENGGDGAGGTGGTAGRGTVGNVNGSGTVGNPGNPGSGIGAGTATSGGVAVYTGSVWLDPTRSTNQLSTSYVRVTYLGPIG